MKKFNILFLVMVVALVFISCTEKEKNNNDIDATELPPSISEKKYEEVKLIKLNDIQKSELKIRTQKISKKIERHNLTVPAFVFPAPNNISIVSAPMDGRVGKIYAHEGEKVKAGDVLLELESLEYGNLIAEYLQSKADETYYSQRLNRIRSLVEKKISSRGDLDKADAEYRRASASARAAFAKLRTVGVSKAEIKNLLTSKEINAGLKITAPISGVIDKHLIDLGQSVVSYEQMLSIVDLEKVLVKAYVSPEDGPFVKPGSNVKVFQKKKSNKFVTGEVSTVNPALDETNKSIVVNTILDTKSKWPKPGENLRAEIEVESLEPVITVPLTSIAYEGDDPVVFVRKNDSEFEMRKLKLGSIYQKTAVVKQGLKEGEEIALNQIFSLKALARFEEYAEE